MNLLKGARNILFNPERITILYYIDGEGFQSEWFETLEEAKNYVYHNIKQIYPNIIVKYLKTVWVE